MVNTRQRLSSSGHTRKEFRQLQQQHRDREDGVQREPGKRGHRVKQVVDENGVPYIMDNEKPRNNSSNCAPELPSAFAAFKALLTVRLLSGKTKISLNFFLEFENYFISNSSNSKFS